MTRKIRISLSVSASLLFAVNASARFDRNPAVTEGLPYCFIEEEAGKSMSERVGHITPVPLDMVLLFPVVEHGVIRGRAVKDGLGSPVLYKPGSDPNALVFKGIVRWPVKRYMVWARGYYMEGIPRVFLYSDKVLGKVCYLVPMTPIKPGTDVQKLRSTVFAELRQGGITVGPEMRITDNADLGSLFRASVVDSWVRDPLSGYRRMMVNWGAPGSKVQFFLTDDDFKLIETYLDGSPQQVETNKTTTNAWPQTNVPSNTTITTNGVK